MLHVYSWHQIILPRALKTEAEWEVSAVMTEINIMTGMHADAVTAS